MYGLKTLNRLNNENHDAHAARILSANDPGRKRLREARKNIGATPTPEQRQEAPVHNPGE